MVVKKLNVYVVTAETKADETTGAITRFACEVLAPNEKAIPGILRKDTYLNNGRVVRVRVIGMVTRPMVLRRLPAIPTTDWVNHRS